MAGPGCECDCIAAAERGSWCEEDVCASTAVVDMSGTSSMDYDEQFSSQEPRELRILCDDAWMRDCAVAVVVRELNTLKTRDQRGGRVLALGGALLIKPNPA